MHGSDEGIHCRESVGKHVEQLYLQVTADLAEHMCRILLSKTSLSTSLLFVLRPLPSMVEPIAASHRALEVGLLAGTLLNC